MKRGKGPRHPARREKGRRRKKQMVRETIYEDTLPLLLEGLWRQIQGKMDEGHEGPFWVGPIECGASQLSRVIDGLRELVKADGRYRIRWGTAQGEHAMQWILHGMAEKRDKVWQPGMR